MFLKLGHSVIEGQMHSIGFTELARVNTEQYFQPVTPFHPFHGYSDYIQKKYKKNTFFLKASFCGQKGYYGIILAMQILCVILN